MGRHRVASLLGFVGLEGAHYTAYRWVPEHDAFWHIDSLATRPVLGAHWDAALPHAGLFATRAIAAGEELTCSRSDAGFVRPADFEQT